MNGIWRESKEEVTDAISQYFSHIFSSSMPDLPMIDSVLNGLECGVEDNMNRLLQRPFTVDKIYNALKQISPNKVPGPDGFNGSFYKTYCHIVGRDVTT